MAVLTRAVRMIVILRVGFTAIDIAGRAVIELVELTLALQYFADDVEAGLCENAVAFRDLLAGAQHLPSAARCSAPQNRRRLWSRGCTRRGCGIPCQLRLPVFGCWRISCRLSFDASGRNVPPIRKATRRSSPSRGNRWSPRARCRYRRPATVGANAARRHDPAPARCRGRRRIWSLRQSKTARNSAGVTSGGVTAAAPRGLQGLHGLAAHGSSPHMDWHRRDLLPRMDLPLRRDRRRRKDLPLLHRG